MAVKVVDIFAGPGGLGEGFDSNPNFQIVLSIERDLHAHCTLETRAFFRQFRRGRAPKEYYAYLRGEISKECLFAAYSKQAVAAQVVARRAELGKKDPRVIDDWIKKALGHDHRTGRWVLVGGPPCQAYYLVGRARRSRESRELFESDERHYLYIEYLRILKRHRPAVFVMENVKGLLSANVAGERIFSKICDDLASAGYDLHSLTGQQTQDLAQDWIPSSFVVRAEDHGIPQTRHRVFIVGLRRGSQCSLASLQVCKNKPTVDRVIGDLPPIRSLVSKPRSAEETWEESRNAGAALASRSFQCSQRRCSSGGRFVKNLKKPKFAPAWLYDPKLGGALNHEPRSHIATDIQRYAFAAVFASLSGRSPSISEFPKRLLPKHRNVVSGTDVPFADRFRVQVAGKPASTITSHISKDGHYYIHPDASQARSLTVREAARLQTFPDNYFFEGPRTEQYHQVGNAVPPLLAAQIAEIVSKCLK